MTTSLTHGHRGSPELAPRLPLEKKLEKNAPHLVSLAKHLTVTLEKKRLHDVTAKVAVVLDASGSMCHQYQNGSVQAVIERLLILAVQFDEAGELDVWAFANEFNKCTPATLRNIKGYVERLQEAPTPSKPEDSRADSRGTRNLSGIVPGLGFSNNEPPVMQNIIETYRETSLPAFVMFVTDGGIAESESIRNLLTEAAHLPIFWQFVGLGGSSFGILEDLDPMTGWGVDNADFFALANHHDISDSELYDRMLDEFPSWLKTIRDMR